VTLRGVAARLREHLRADDLLARFVGEEFAVVLPETALESAAACAERLRGAVGGRPFEFDGHALGVTLSAGVAALEPGESAAELTLRADARLYDAKRAGRDRVCLR
jgi:diguanylate cyclase (GGDEF)-like protein